MLTFVTRWTRPNPAARRLIEARRQRHRLIQLADNVCAIPEADRHRRPRLRYLITGGRCVGGISEEVNRVRRFVQNDTVDVMRDNDRHSTFWFESLRERNREYAC